MTPSTDLTPTDASTEIAVSAEEQALAEKIKAKADPKDFKLPALKLAQGQSREAQEGLAEPGQYVNSLSGYNYGETVEFIVADQFKGRFWHEGNDGNGAAAQGDVIPWPDHPDHGKLFVDSPDAEETFRAEVAEGSREWGSGPGISTTFNFVGVAIPDAEWAKAEELDPDPTPVVLRLMRTSKSAGEKLTTFVNAMSKTPWDYVYKLSANRREKGRYAYHVVTVERGDEATAEQRQLAVDLAVQAQGGIVVDDPTGEPGGEAKPAKPADTGGADF